MPFMPNVGDIIEFEGCQYTFPPARPEVDYPLETEGGKATVIRVQRVHDQSFWALKVFKHRYRSPEQENTAQRLATLSALPGLQATRQFVIRPDAPLARNEPDLHWAVLMPWVEGNTWGEMLGQVRDGKRTYSPEEAMALARHVLEVLVALERAQIVHCDLSAGNVIGQMPEDSPFRIQLVDLEDMLIRGHMPMSYTPGSYGYALPGVEKTACAEGDRYAGAILVAEALALGLPYARDLASSEGLLRGSRYERGAQVRFEYILYEMKVQQPEFAVLLARAWNARSLSDCASLAELSASLCVLESWEPEDETTPFEKMQQSLAEFTQKGVARLTALVHTTRLRIAGNEKLQQIIASVPKRSKTEEAAIRPELLSEDLPTNRFADPPRAFDAAPAPPQMPPSAGTNTSTSAPNSK